MRQSTVEQTRNTLEAYLSRSLSLVERKAEPDKLDLQERNSLTLAEIKLKNDHLQENIDDLKSNRDLRKKFSERSWRFLCIYSVCSFVLVLMNGFKIFGFSLDASVATAIVGSTALSAIGLVHQINKGLFAGK